MVYLRRASTRPSRAPSVKFASVSQKRALKQVYSLQSVFSTAEGASTFVGVFFLISDEVRGDSCLILLLLCLVTVVISVGGTALYCTLVGSYSNICTDFTHNVDFYMANVRGFLAGLRRWLPLPM